jgi:hypothetical protein
MTAVRSAARGKLLCAAVLLTALLAVPSVASASPLGSFSCRGSAARVTLLTGQTPIPTIEPFVANAQDKPCVPATADVLTPTTVGPISVNAVNVSTTEQNLAYGGASSSVTNPTVTLGSGGSGLTIHADVLTASAKYQCSNGRLSAVTSGQVVNLTINGQSITVPAGTNKSINLGPLGTLVLNRVVTTSNSVVREAVYLQSPLADVVLSEATADYSGSPCMSTGYAHLVITPKAAARRIARHQCVRSRFYATIKGTHIARVIFSLDGSAIATRTRNPFRVTIHPTPGRHTLSARVRFTPASKTKSRTFRVHFTGCAGPSFTG